jgi:hypothetical protein
VNSQTTSTNDRIKVVVNQQGDTLVQMGYEDARTLLSSVLHGDYADSMLVVYSERDSLNRETITFQKEALLKLTKENENIQKIVDNLNQVIVNKTTESTLKDETIGEQKSEIKKQKTLKIIGFTTSVIVPILITLLRN